MRSNAFTFLQSIGLPKLLCGHANRKSIEHIFIVGVVVGLWIIVEQLDLSG